ncbi:hypothetical protein F441_12662 [Phytophthora nicotianae CJ01A1]|uniref:Uncharacterized protein n=3 Tax=Phytophthora nicotianae TaxID=4792 RepID=W2WP12_PHYNI|nr:hypothetical protein L915_12424 [Phytophthora nicotianae]ETO70781.1 hypothetical protein F444_12807 [Phytophthora nicotianae P1976]ETP11903.1 hypothetical protein F441_12662 [Phytophthora nicotianae CJ01A1]
MTTLEADTTEFDQAIGSLSCSWVFDNLHLFRLFSLEQTGDPCRPQRLERDS